LVRSIRSTLAQLLQVHLSAQVQVTFESDLHLQAQDLPESEQQPDEIITASVMAMRAKRFISTFPFVEFCQL